MRRLFQTLTGIAFIVAEVWAIRKPDYDSIIAAVVGLATFVGLFVQENASKNRKADRALLEQFKVALPSKGSISFINNFNMAGFSFDTENLSDLYNFISTWVGAEHEFLNKELEKKRKHLYLLIADYLQLIAFDTFPIGNLNRQTVPPEWEEDQPERFGEVVSRLHNKAGEIVQAHQELIRAARNILEK